MSRLPIRIRLTLPFALAMALVLAGLGMFVYLRVGATLLNATDEGLRVSTIEATQRIKAGRPAIDRDAEAAGTVAQIFAPGGAVVTSDPSGFPTLLTPPAVASVLAGHALHETVSLATPNEPWRVFAIPAQLGGQREVLVLAGSLANRAESLERLRDELLVASPLALLVATLAGYLLAGAALRPVEAMRRKAAAISAATRGSRLPVPASRDEVSWLAETLNDMLGRLETALEHERLFVAEASHELRTPLALLRTELELALRKPRSRSELEDALRSAAEESERLTALAANLLMIARSDDGTDAGRRETVEAHELLAAVAERFSARARALDRAVEVEPGADFWFAAEVRGVEQALGNLVDNALVHGAGTVMLAARVHGTMIELHVCDEGGGFAPSFAPRAFERFSRAEDARRRPGSGLGLAIVRAVALAHGGETGIGRAPGGGADVWLSLPLAPDRLESSASPGRSAYAQGRPMVVPSPAPRGRARRH